MSFDDITVIIADDLTGANDTAAQYFRRGKRTKVITDINSDFALSKNADVWAVSTESRNIGKEEALDRVICACEKLKNELNTDNFYKKIDSTLRGNVGLEIMAVLDAIGKDAAIIAPAYIEENRTTIGGYQLLNGIAIERTQCALDPKAPIYESYIPDILSHNLNSSLHDLIDTIGLKTVTKGAALIISKIKELIENGKKLIVVDAMSTTDLEQIALAISKCGYNILPCGSAGLADAINKISSHDLKNEPNIKHTPNLPKLIISGSATQLSANQISKLKQEKPNIYCVELTTKDIIFPLYENISQDISQKLSCGIDVIVHSSNIKSELNREEAENILIDAGVAKEEFPAMITDYFAKLVREISVISEFVLITSGGETSYKCAQKLDSKYLEILDTILPFVPLSIDAHGRVIVTKSGNFGTNSTLVDIIKYFDDKK